MTIVAIDGMSFCPVETVLEEVAERLGFQCFTQDALLAEAARASRITTNTFKRLIENRTSPFGALRDNRPVQIASLRVMLAALLERDSVALGGSLGYLLPSSATHIMKVAIVASRDYRVAKGCAAGLSSDQAEQAVAERDEARAAWAKRVVGETPWRPDLFDMVLPADSLSSEEIAGRIVDNARKEVVATTDSSVAALGDYRLAGELQLVFARRGVDVDVACRDGDVQIQIKKHAIFLERLKKQLVEIATAFPGVRSASANPGPKYQAANLYLDLRDALPSKVLLVDDEKAFVETLSKRLHTRKIDNVVAYGGAEALIRVKQEMPDVMVLDLKMPGIDGLDVLRVVKENNPETEVIVLTAHGSDNEERLVFQLGAFAYLRKPVDIRELTDTMTRAYQRVQENTAKESVRDEE